MIERAGETVLLRLGRLLAELEGELTRRSPRSLGWYQSSLSLSESTMSSGPLVGISLPWRKASMLSAALRAWPMEVVAIWRETEPSPAREAFLALLAPTGDRRRRTDPGR